jgi:hypothetical protein
MADDGQLTLFLDLGAGVLDGAMVETAAYLVGATNSNEIEFPIWRNAEFDCKGHARGLEFLHLLLVRRSLSFPSSSTFFRVFSDLWARSTPAPPGGRSGAPRQGHGMRH